MLHTFAGNFLKSSYFWMHENPGCYILSPRFRGYYSWWMALWVYLGWMAFIECSTCINVPSFAKKLFRERFWKRGFLESSLHKTFWMETVVLNRGKSNFCKIKLVFEKFYFSKELLKLPQTKFKIPFEIILFLKPKVLGSKLKHFQAPKLCKASLNAIWEMIFFVNNGFWSKNNFGSNFHCETKSLLKPVFEFWKP